MNEYIKRITNSNSNYLQESRKDIDKYLDLLDITNLGYFLVSHKDGVSNFLKYSSNKFLEYMPNNVLTKYNLIYTIEKPLILTDNNNLVVVFSSFQINPYLVDNPCSRYFVQDFSKIAKYIPKNTYILRIADIGGVAGNFYLNTNYDSHIEKNIFKLIQNIRKTYDIKKSSSLLLGYSKGATASLYYGVKYKYKIIAIDPIVSDDYHIKMYNNSHFTQKIFPISKEVKFFNLLKEKKLHTNIYIITSQNSQQYSYIMDILGTSKTFNRLNIINSLNPNIKEHPDVGVNTINLTIMLINNILYKINKRISFDVLC